MIDTISKTREQLTTHVARFRDAGASAEPVVFGDHRKPEAVLLSFETFQVLLDIAEDAVITQRIRERVASDTGERIPMADLAKELGINLDSL